MYTRGSYCSFAGVQDRLVPSETQFRAQNAEPRPDGDTPRAKRAVTMTLPLALEKEYQLITQHLPAKDRLALACVSRACRDSHRESTTPEQQHALVIWASMSIIEAEQFECDERRRINREKNLPPLPSRLDLLRLPALKVLAASRGIKVRPRCGAPRCSR